MGIKFYKEPKLEKPDMICGWPGIGNIGIIAVDTLRGVLKAEEFGEIEPWDFFFPEEISIRGGRLRDLKFPTNKFYFKRLPKKDLIFFIGEEQSMEHGKRYAEGEKAEEMVNLILEVAEGFGCQRVYTSGAAAASIHHRQNSRVVIAANQEYLVKEMERYGNTIPISERESSSMLVGLSGILLGLAKNRDLEGICLMGEIPNYLAGSNLPYPKGSKSIAQLFAEILEVEIDLSYFDEKAKEIEDGIVEFFKRVPVSEILEAVPPEIRLRVKESFNRFLDYVINYRPAGPGPITKEDADWIIKHIDELFKKGGKDGGRL
jgi:hypothetical protein